MACTVPAGSVPRRAHWSRSMFEPCQPGFELIGDLCAKKEVVESLRRTAAVQRGHFSSDWFQPSALESLAASRDCSDRRVRFLLYPEIVPHPSKIWVNAENHR